MSALWPLGEGTVRDIHRQLGASRRRAYTTIMTIMDRLSQKGIVTRRKVGRAYRYQANLSANDARVSAVEKIVAGFFDGSAEALAAHLAALVESAASPLPSLSPQAAPRPKIDLGIPVRQLPGAVDVQDALAGESLPNRLDESLL